MFFSPSPQKAALIVAELESKREKAKSDTQKAKADLGAASLAALGDSSGSDKSGMRPAEMKERALRSLEQAERDTVEAEAALEAAKVHLKDALEAEAKSQGERVWKKVKALTEQRAALAADIERDAAALVEKLNKHAEAGKEIFQTAPSKDGYYTHSLLAPAQTFNSFKQHLAKLGCAWAYRAPWGNLEQVLTFAENTKKANDWVLTFQDSQLRPAKSLPGK